MELSLYLDVTILHCRYCSVYPEGNRSLTEMYTELVKIWAGILVGFVSVVRPFFCC